MKRLGKCVNKRAYSFRDEALIVASRVEKQAGNIYRVYECPTCLDFHLTTATKKQATKIRCRRRKQHREAIFNKLKPLLLDVYGNPQPTTFWSMILGIIKVSRI